MTALDWRAALAQLGVLVHVEADRFDMLSDAELGELARDIDANFMTDPLRLWRESDAAPWQLVDGRNRVAAMARLVEGDVRIEGAISLAIRYEGDQIKPRLFVRSVNVNRRHLSPERRRQHVADLLDETPTLTDRAMGKELGVDHKTIAADRALMGNVPHKDERTEASGRAARGRKPGLRPPSWGSSQTPADHASPKPPITGPRPSPALTRDSAIGALSAEVRSKPSETIADFIRIVADEAGARRLPDHKRRRLVVDFMKALDVSLADIKPVEGLL
jgi:hypothetical protein